ncbi:MAG: hypothetical protein GY877_11195 [Hyphomicrobium sp.]|nr:hypothetical protein [Hyphomicrobium sp.]
MAWAVRCDGKAVALAAIYCIWGTQRVLLMRVQRHGKTMAAGGVGRWERLFCGGTWVVFGLFRNDLDIGQIDDHALLLALLVEVTEDGDGNR